MTLEEAQACVDQWIKTIGVRYFSELTNLAQLVEEVGELAAALRHGTFDEKVGEFADVLAWLTTIANVVGVDLSEAVMRKYGSGCPGCGHLVCACGLHEKP